MFVLNESRTALVTLVRSPSVIIRKTYSIAYRTGVSTVLVYVRTVDFQGFSINALYSTVPKGTIKIVVVIQYTVSYTRVKVTYHRYTNCRMYKGQSVLRGNLDFRSIDIFHYWHTPTSWNDTYIQGVNEGLY